MRSARVMIVQEVDVLEKILLVEDDEVLARTLCSFLAEEDFAVTAVSGQGMAETVMGETCFDIALVDISLADGNGFSVCAEAKAHGIPVIFLTASADEHSVVLGLDMGADDYIAKPFRPRELISRIRSVLRRAGKRQNIFRAGRLRVDMDRASVFLGNDEVFLSALEYRLLLVFVNNRGRILSRTKLLEEIWDCSGDYVSDNTLTVYIKRLREKIEPDPQQPQLIRTVRGLGYRMEG